MHVEAYDELVNNFPMSLPVPKPPVPEHTEMHYMLFEEAVLHPFTDDHQPSLQTEGGKEA
jgi:hypothetical protein